MIGSGSKLGNVLESVNRTDADDWRRGFGCRAQRQVALEPPVTLGEGRRRCADGELRRMWEGRRLGVERDGRGEL